MNIKTVLAVYSAIILCTSCNDNIRKKAIEHETYSQLNGIIEYFAKCNYRLPGNKSELCDFILAWESIDAESYCYDAELLQTFNDKTTEIESYKDSIFIYLPKDKIGCCVYGSPTYWLQNPDKYPTERKDYLEQFSISCFDTSNRYMFGVGKNWLSGKNIRNAAKQFPFNGLAKIDVQKNNICIYETYPPNGSTRLNNIDLDERIKELKTSIIDSIPSSTNISLIIVPIGNLVK